MHLEGNTNMIPLTLTLNTNTEEDAALTEPNTPSKGNPKQRTEIIVQSLLPFLPPLPNNIMEVQMKLKA